MAVVKREQSVPSKTKKEVNAGGEKNKKKNQSLLISIINIKGFSGKKNNRKRGQTNTHLISAGFIYMKAIHFKGRQVNSFLG